MRWPKKVVLTTHYDQDPQSAVRSSPMLVYVNAYQDFEQVKNRGNQRVYVLQPTRAKRKGRTR